MTMLEYVLLYGLFEPEFHRDRTYHSWDTCGEEMVRGHQDRVTSKHESSGGIGPTNSIRQNGFTLKFTEEVDHRNESGKNIA